VGVWLMFNAGSFDDYLAVKERATMGSGGLTLEGMHGSCSGLEVSLTRGRLAGGIYVEDVCDSRIVQVDSLLESLSWSLRGESVSMAKIWGWPGRRKGCLILVGQCQTESGKTLQCGMAYQRIELREGHEISNIEACVVSRGNLCS